MGSAGYILLKKLKPLKVGLKKWNVEVFGNIINKLKASEAYLHNLELVVEDRELDEAEIRTRREARAEVWRLSKIVERIWLQKSRMNWTLKGDRNTRFFHVMTKCRQSRNEINFITKGEVVYEDPSHVKRKVFQHFKGHFSEDWCGRLELEGTFKSVQGSCDFERLEVFSKTKIKAAVMDCDGNKALGPDDFNMGLVKGINSSFITLVPKKENPKGLNDYRPISLTVFLSGRNILDGVLIANEVVDGWKKKKRKGHIIKLDFEKAYDSIN
ncbi:uncharacterized protein LOC114300668 [Camellia sinensis]|uniref:uncharacterized protein LOC114300668 n=1 Tax=Camellia sinensis TaxID=4442 RepID=UPI0010356869|nr:uncharacterized protein LOC114300668 [Camellia sinensis]